MENKIKELRTGHSVTQAALAKYLGVAQNTLSYWEQGKYDVDNESLKKIAEYFKCSVDCVLGLEDVKRNKVEVDFFADFLSEKEKKIIIAYRKNVAMQAAVDKILGVYEEEPEYIFRAAKSENNSAPIIKKRDEDAIIRFKRADGVTSEEDL